MSDISISKTSNDLKLRSDGDMSLNFVRGRAQKIVTALYLVSGLWDIHEPLREELRKSAIELLSYIRTLSDAPSGSDRLTDTVRSLLVHLLSLLDLAARTGLVSVMNQGFLAEEITSFSKEIGTIISGAGKHSLSESLKDVLESSQARAALLPEKNVPYKGQPKRQDKGQTFQPKKTPAPIFGTFSHVTGPIKDISLNPLSGGSERKEKIYRIIQEKGSLTIKDIATVMPEYSEKTIQRDLVDMVGAGRVKKKGERRWTVYYI